MFFYCSKSGLLSDQIKAFHLQLFGSIRHPELGLLKPVISTETGHPLLILSTIMGTSNPLLRPQLTGVGRWGGELEQNLWRPTKSDLKTSRKGDTP